MAHLPLTILIRESFIQDELKASSETKLKILNECTSQISKAMDLLVNALNNKKKILLCGNGGSAADSQHIATELVIRMLPRERAAIPAIALTTDSSILTAGANDIGFENVFARSVEALGNAGDILIAITTSGNSPNILKAIEKAKSKGMVTIGLLGKDGGKAKPLCDHSIVVPSNDTQRIQEGHITIGHILCGLIEREMFGEMK
ncbi:MAG: D-sedoheptulose 7-phosphate isomerase [Ignavibacteriales bacterium]|nr:D-sedoheptulose 7-phosphate isomerase [Ignavibacteriales bacterium]